MIAERDRERDTYLESLMKNRFKSSQQIKKGSRSNVDNTGINMIASNSIFKNNNNDTRFMIDSGCTHHIVNNTNKLDDINFYKQSNNRKVYLGSQDEFALEIIGHDENKYLPKINNNK
jgi:hypothetical protein